MVIVSITPEIALEKSRTYAGGLGVLEGDKFYAAGDMGLNYMALSLLYRHGYVKIRFLGDSAVFENEKQNPEFYGELRPEEEFTISLKNTTVYVRPWVYKYKTARAILFEATCPEWARRLTDKVYIEEYEEEKYLKYLFLAKVSAEYLTRYVGLENISVIDLEESYTALILYFVDVSRKARIILHTPGPWGHLVLPSELLKRELGTEFVSGLVNMTSEAVKKLREITVVSQKQKDIIPRIFPEAKDKLKAITNGIYLNRWMDQMLLNAWLSGNLDLNVLKNARCNAKKELESLLCKYKAEIDIRDKIVVTWSRRLSRYKRPYFIAKFIEENPGLEAIFVLAGKPHPKDSDGLRYLTWFRDLSLKMRNVIYIPDYDIDVARILVKGSDVWLFTPFSGWEACGTSYMKALVNGVPVLSSRDGGALELIEDGINGWLFGSDIREFINIYEDPRAKQIDEKEYKEFAEKLLKAIDLYYLDKDKYWEIALNAWRTTPLKVDIKKVLKQYYFATNSTEQ